MMVTFVSQCEKKALPKTRRVLDAFANRIGDNTWQTVITEDGLLAVKKMLRKTASKSTAVSCHWIRSRSRSQLLWVVGKKDRFNFEGVVPVNRKKLDPNLRDSESGWEMNEAIVLAAGISGLFHDFGKANALFQKKLSGKSKSLGEPYRHEWVSLRLFEVIAAGKKDTDWLTTLAALTNASAAQELEKKVLEDVVKDGVAEESDASMRSNPLKELAPFAKLVGWLIVSHHRLPMSHKLKVENSQMGKWLSNCFDCHWNSKNAISLHDIDSQTVKDNWHFPAGTPLLSATWQERAVDLSKRALKYPRLLQEFDWLKLRFVSHLSRLSLMLADHYYSSLTFEESTPKYRDPTYQANANTEKPAVGSKRKQAKIKQQLDEHNIGVGINALKFARNLPALKTTLPSIAQHKVFTRSTSVKKYQWQNKAFNTAKAVAKDSEQHGFFGVNMASTGCGKTLANGRIMYALADEREGCRFSVALGLRTLTLQTGDAYRNLLKLGEGGLAVLIGSQAVKTLHQLELQSQKLADQQTGSESADAFFDPISISYDGQIYDGRLKKWLSSSPKLEQLVSAPVLVSTIDHLMPATESKRGGKQIAPMLRLLTSDLILDEPDDFGLEDLPALCRLVNWTGMLGSRVLLSSATLPPSLIGSLFEAYCEGRKQFNQANFTAKKPDVVCAWFDEFNSESENITNMVDFKKSHKTFVTSRIKRLEKESKVLRKAELIAIPESTANSEILNKRQKQKETTQLVGDLILEQSYVLHDHHHVSNPSGLKVSLGVVRIANINPMVAIAKYMAEQPVKENYEIHLCVYHSQFPLALRSHKESRLDDLLTRYDESEIWQQPEIQTALANSTAKNHLFIVVGTSVVEVGRDHDYDWAIAEPSSLRSLIQLAGRIQRHRQKLVTTANFLILSRNIRAINGESPAYIKPGFESSQLPLAYHDLSQLLTNELETLNAIPRIVEPIFTMGNFKIDADRGKAFARSVSSFSVQEHRALKIKLGLTREQGRYISNTEANLWWKEESHADWHAEFIKQTEFRRSQPQEEFILRMLEDEDLGWYQLDDTRYPFEYGLQNKKFVFDEIQLAEGVHWWFKKSPEDVFEKLAEKLNESTRRVSNKFGGVQLRTPNENSDISWVWHPQLGVYEIKE